MNNTDLYPLKFSPIAKERLWGGNYMAKNFGKPFDEKKKIGESWELSDVPNDESIVSNGSLCGESIRQIIENYGCEKIIGKKEKRFPLLIKYIDASDKLSIQVHPDDEYAEKHYRMKGKTEMWVVLTAKKGAKLIAGLSVKKDELRKSIENKEDISKMFNYVDVKEGDVIYLPAGRVHAILDGVVIAEIQETSDLTFRLYDWDRLDDNGKERELHIKESFDVIKEKDEEPLKLDEKYQKFDGYETAPLIKNSFFNVRKVILEKGASFKSDTNGSFEIVMVLKGEGNIVSGRLKTEAETYSTFLIPACLGGYSIENLSENKSVFILAGV